jgi:FdhD protein
MIDGALPTTYLVRNGNAWTSVDGAVIEEHTLTIHANGHQVVTLLCSPIDLEALGIGFLRNEGMLDDIADVELVELSHKGTCVDIWLRTALSIPEQNIRTSGCGGGVTFDNGAVRQHRVPLDKAVSYQQVIDRYFDLRAAERLYPIARGVHASALCTADALLLWAEDLGRHNTLDKLTGKALVNGIDTTDLLLVTTGRISSEMLAKAARMGVSIVASRTSPTSRSVALADAWDMTVIGYIRRTSMRIYATPERITTETSQVKRPLAHSPAL